MPQVIPAVAFTVGGVAVTYGTIAQVAVFAGSLVYSSVQQRKLKKSLSATSTINTARTLNMRSTAESWKLVVGEVRVGGNIVFAWQTGTNQQFTHLAIVHADHECDSVQKHYLNGEEVTINGSGWVTSPAKWANVVRIRNHLGADTQTVDTVLQSEVGSSVWTDNHRGRGHCWTYLLLDTSSEAFASGMPTYTVLLRGAKCYDPRTGTTGWTQNLALCTRWYLALARERGGVGATADELPDAAWNAFANLCDEDVSLAAGGTEKRYTANGMVDTASAPGEVLVEFSETGAVSIPYYNGQFVPRGGAYSAPVMDLTEDDFLGPIQLVTHDSARDCFNGCKGLYISPVNNWQPSDFPPHKNDTYKSEDGGERIWQDISLSLVTSPTTAQRLAKIKLERSRQDITFAAPCRLRTLDLVPGCNVTITRPRYGFVAKPFEVTDMAFRLEADAGAMRFSISPVFRETASGVWDWNNGEETGGDLAPNSSLVQRRTVPDVSGFALATASLSERTALPRVKVTWSAPASVLVNPLGWTRLEYKKTSESTWVSWGRIPGEKTVEYITDLQVGVSTDVRAKHVNSYGHESANWVSATITPAGGEGTYTALLTNEAHAVSCAADGTPISGEIGSGGRAFSDVLAFAGAHALTAVSSAPGVGQYSISVSTHSGTATFTKVDNDTVRCDSLTTDSAVGRVTIDLEGLLTLYKDFTVTKVTAGSDGNPGTDGDDAEVVYVLSDAAAVNRSEAGTYTPSTINFAAWSKIGAAAPAAYSGRFKISTFNGSTWTDRYTSSGDESSVAYSIPSLVIAIRVRLYLAGGTVTMVDEQIVPVTFDGATGPAGSGVAASTSGVGNASSTTWVDCCSVSVSVLGGQTKAIIVSGSVLNASGATRSVYMRIVRDSTQLGSDYIYGNIPDGESRPMNMSAIDSPGAGTYTYKAQVRGTASGVDVYGYADAFAVI